MDTTRESVATRLTQSGHPNKLRISEAERAVALKSADSASHTIARRLRRGRQQEARTLESRAAVRLGQRTVPQLSRASLPAPGKLNDAGSDYLPRPGVAVHVERLARV